MSEETKKSENIDSEKRASAFQRSFDKAAPIIEILVWLSLGFAIIIQAYYRGLLIGYYMKGDFISFVGTYSLESMVGFLICIFPILVRLIFGELPFELIRNLIRKPRNNFEIKSDKNVSIENLQILRGGKKELSIGDEVEEEPNVLLTQIKEATQISEKIYTRSGVYLLVGCLIAFVGVFIFYSPYLNQNLTTVTTDTLTRFMDFLPRIGALLFVEFVAFFFLKQYRIMMEEYRYYEAIKRKKQNNYLIVNLIEKYSDQEEVLKQILDKCSFDELNRKIGKEDSAEILEVQKLGNQEFNLIEKVMDLIKEIKK